MCGFLVYKEKGDNSKISRRGPDCTNVYKRSNLTFVHNLLSVTGDFAPQPFVEDDIVCLYNGQVYNQPYSRTDGEVLIPLYRQHGTTFARHLDGEFAIALYDFRNAIAIFATDPFNTKPLFINGIECASYRSGVGGEKAAPNEIVVKGFDGTVLERAPVLWLSAEAKNRHYKAPLRERVNRSATRVDELVVSEHSGQLQDGPELSSENGRPVKATRCQELICIYHEDVVRL